LEFPDLLRDDFGRLLRERVGAGRPSNHREDEAGATLHSQIRASACAARRVER
jgi:hypothetical protein